MSRPVLNVVVTCTKQKRFSAPKELCVASLKKGSVATRFAEWKSRLAATKIDKCEVSELYSGDHWATALRFGSNKFEIKTWVASAGYGLLELSDKVAPYAATFSKPNKDSVFNKLSEHEYVSASKLWWKHLTSWRMTSHCRSLKSLAKSRPSEPILIVASDKYLRAIGEDLVEAATELDDRQLLSILSVGCKKLSGLNENLLPCDARLQHVVGGARRSINTRVAAHLISDSPSLPTFPALKNRLILLLKDLPDIPKFDRTPVTDEVVLQFILSELSKDSSSPHTPLLRRFRDGGKACEQSRFREMYQQVKAEIS